MHKDLTILVAANAALGSGNLKDVSAGIWNLTKGQIGLYSAADTNKTRGYNVALQANDVLADARYVKFVQGGNNSLTTKYKNRPIVESGVIDAAMGVNFVYTANTLGEKHSFVTGDFTPEADVNYKIHILVKNDMTHKWDIGERGFQVSYTAKTTDSKSDVLKALGKKINDLASVFNAGTKPMTNFFCVGVNSGVDAGNAVVADLTTTITPQTGKTAVIDATYIAALAPYVAANATATISLLDGSDDVTELIIIGTPCELEHPGFSLDTELLVSSIGTGIPVTESNALVKEQGRGAYLKSMEEYFVFPYLYDSIPEMNTRERPQPESFIDPATYYKQYLMTFYSQNNVTYPTSAGYSQNRILLLTPASASTLVTSLVAIVTPYIKSLPVQGLHVKAHATNYFA